MANDNETMVFEQEFAKIPQNMGDYDELVAQGVNSFGIKERVFRYGCEWESKVENNTYAPATLNESTGVITPDTTHWRHVSGSYEMWLVDHDYGKLSAANVKDVNQGNKSQQTINSEVAQKVAGLENAVGTGGTVDQKIIAETSRAQNAESALGGRVTTLEAAVGSGGSVDSRIAAAKAEIKGNATSACDTLGEAEAKINANTSAINTESSRAQAAESNLQQLYEALTQSDIEVVNAVPASGVENKIYRVVGENSYSDYMFNSSDLNTPVKMATYNNAIDDVPTAGSDNLVNSGGVYKQMNSQFSQAIEPTIVLQGQAIQEYVQNQTAWLQPLSGSVVKAYNISRLRNDTILYIYSKTQKSSPSATYCYYAFFSSTTFNTNYSVGVPESVEIGEGFAEKAFRVEIPENAMYLLVGSTYNDKVSVISDPPKGFNEEKGELEILQSKDISTYELEPIAVVSGKFIDTYGDVHDSQPFSYKVYELNGILSNLKISARTRWGNSLYAFFSSLNFSHSTLVHNRVPDIDQTDFASVVDENVIIPSGALYVAVNNYDNNDNYKNYAEANFRKIISCSTLTGKKWACVGDSLTEENARTNIHYFDYISKETGIKPINYGKSGTGYAKSYTTFGPFYERILDIDTNSDIVTIFGSFNDLAAGLRVGDVDSTGTDTLAGCINKTIDNLYSVMPIARLGIISPTPWSSFQPGTNQNAQNYVNIIRDICQHRSIPFLNLYECSNLRPWDATFRTLAYSKDDGGGVHPDEVGHSLFAPMIRQFIESLI